MTASALNQLRVVLTYDGDFVQADAVLHRALAIQEKALGPEGTVLNDLGVIYLGRRDTPAPERTSSGGCR